MLARKLQEEVAKIVKKNWQIAADQVAVEIPKEDWQGDFTTNIALKVSARWGVPSVQVADVLVGELVQNKLVRKYFSKVSMAGPGFVNFFISPDNAYKQAKSIFLKGKFSDFRGKKIVIEYSSPNIAKPMHVGHLRSTIIGQALVNIYKILGAKVISLNYLGDWGTQFGKLVVAWEKWGKKTELKRNPIEEMLRVYVLFHEKAKEDVNLDKQAQETFKKLEKGNVKIKALWRSFRQLSLKEFDTLYKRLHISFNKIEGESFYEGALSSVLKDLVQQDLLVQNQDGSIVAMLDNKNLPPLLVQKSDGASLYATRDLAALRSRVKKYAPHKMIYVVANQQALYFEQMFAIASLAGYQNKTKLEHVKFGLVLGEEGKKMATREGTLIKLDEVLNKAVDLAWRIVEKKKSELTPSVKVQVAEIVGVGAVKYNDLSQNRLTDIAFNWQKMLSVEGNSGPYLQYTYVRLKSILKKAGRFKAKKYNFKKIEDGDLSLLRKIIQYHNALQKSAEENGPHLLALYLYQLAEGVNSYYHESPVLKADEPVRTLRLELVTMAADILKQGLNVLGLEVVERM